MEEKKLKNNILILHLNFKYFELFSIFIIYNKFNFY